MICVMCDSPIDAGHLCGACVDRVRETRGKVKAGERKLYMKTAARRHAGHTLPDRVGVFRVEAYDARVATLVCPAGHKCERPTRRVAYTVRHGRFAECSVCTKDRTRVKRLAVARTVHKLQVEAKGERPVLKDRTRVTCMAVARTVHKLQVEAKGERPVLQDLMGRNAKSVSIQDLHLAVSHGYITIDGTRVSVPTKVRAMLESEQ